MILPETYDALTPEGALRPTDSLHELVYGDTVFPNVIVAYAGCQKFHYVLIRTRKRRVGVRHFI